MSLLKHFVFLAFLLPLGLVAQETKKAVNINVQQTIDGEENQYEFKYIIDGTEDVETLIEKVKKEIGINEEAEGMAIEMNVNVDEFVINEQPVDKPFLGVILDVNKNVDNINGVTLETSELTINKTMANGAAKEAGVLDGDKIVALAGENVESMSDLQEVMAGYAIGDQVTLTVDRAGQNMDFVLNLTARPETTEASYFKHMQKEITKDFDWESVNCDWANCDWENCDWSNCDWSKCDWSACTSTPRNKALLGVTGEDVENGGIKILTLTENGGAEQAGLRVNDVIKTVDKKEIADMEGLIETLASYKAAEKVKVTFVRDGKTKKEKVTLQENPWAQEKTPRFSQKRAEIKENVEIIRLGDDEMDSLIEGREVKVRITQEDEFGVPFTKEVSIQLEDGADPCPEFNVVITRLDEVDKEVVAENDPSMDMKKMGDLKVINLSLFPNPNSGQFELDFSLDQAAPVTVRMISIDGKEVYREQIENFTGKYNNYIDISGNTAGVYVLQIIQGEEILNRKVVIDK